jgi:hypothetical protein
MLQEVRDVVFAKLPKVYIIFCLCNDKDKYEGMKEKQKLKESNDLLKAEYERSKYIIYLIGIYSPQEANVFEQ